MNLDLLRDDFEHALHTDPARAHTLPARFYLDPEVFEREKEAIFYRHWHYVGHLSQLERAGDYLTKRIADESIFVMRGEDGALRGFYNVCRHRAHELLEGSGRVDAIVCPYHAWTYRSDGSLRHARNAHKVPGFDHAAFCLPQIRVESFCGLVFVNLDNDAEPLASVTDGIEESLRKDAPFIDEVRPAESWSFSTSNVMAANWKVVVDNFLECYHCDKGASGFLRSLRDVGLPDRDRALVVGAARAEGEGREQRVPGPERRAGAARHVLVPVAHHHHQHAARRPRKPVGGEHSAPRYRPRLVQW